jgi:hypothetical protein
MLMAVVVYLYTVIAFNFFRKFYTKEEDDEKEENCKDMLTVKMISIDSIDRKMNFIFSLVF